MNAKQFVALARDLSDVCKRHKVRVQANGSADDDSGLKAWIEIVSVGEDKNGRYIEKIECKCEGIGIRGIVSVND